MTAIGQLVIDETRPDLGGNVHGGDPRSWCPVLWAALIEEFGIRSMLDVGCGEGQAVSWFQSHALDVIGIDGFQANIDQAGIAWVELHDLLTGPYVYPVDMVWCCEVVEHIDPAKVDNVLDTLANGRVVAMTHAVPDQAGHHHVNCQPSEYWIERMVSLGYRHDWDETRRWREVAATDGEMGDNYFRRTGLVFVR